MASQPRQFHLSSANAHSTSADTTFTKIFVGGLAWETQRDKMQLYFEQFGEILEAVVITDKHTGRSKGYGFVTFKTPEAAARACFDPSPVIDGRQANCNLASLGATHRPRFGNNRFWPPMSSSSYRGSSFFHQPPHYASLPYSIYSYSDGYSHENMYPVPMSYYGLASGGQQQQISPYYLPGFYPYYTQYTQSSQAQGGFGLNYPQMLHYPYAPPHLGSNSAILSFPATTAVQ